MNISMSKDAEGDGAWGTVLNHLKGFTFEVTKTDQTFFVGRIIEADEEMVTFLIGEKDLEMPVFLDEIDEMEYL